MLNAAIAKERQRSRSGVRVRADWRRWQCSGDTPNEDVVIPRVVTNWLVGRLKANAPRHATFEGGGGREGFQVARALLLTCSFASRASERAAYCLSLPAAAAARMDGKAKRGEGRGMEWKEAS